MKRLLFLIIFALTLSIPLPLEAANTTFVDGEGIDSTDAGGTFTTSCEDATSSNKGVATFNTDNFTVTSGDVTIKSGGINSDEILDGTIVQGDINLTTVTLTDFINDKGYISTENDTLYSVCGREGVAGTSISASALTVSTGGTITVGTTQWSSGNSIDGEQIANDTIDDDSIDFVDVTLADLSNDSGYITSYTEKDTLLNVVSRESIAGGNISASNVIVQNTASCVVVSLEGGTYDTYLTPGIPTATIYYRLPLTDGTTGQFLRTDGSANLSFATPSGTGDMLKSTYDSDEDGDVNMLAGGLAEDVSAYEGLVKISGGDASAITDGSTNWNTAYGWGNHSLQNYIKGEGDTLYSVVAREGIAGANISASNVIVLIGTASAAVIDVSAGLENSSGGAVIIRDTLQVNENITAYNLAGNKTIQFTITEPDQLDATSLLPIWSNESGKTFNITSIKGWSDTTYDVTLKKMDNTGANVATVANFGIDTAGTNIFTGTTTAASSAIITNTQVLYFDNSADVPNEIKLTVIGQFN